MKELPILFSTPMVEAILDNRKTMTRRTSGLQQVNYDPHLWRFDGFDEENIPAFEIIREDGSFTEIYKAVKPRYQVGDHLWVRETFTVLEHEHCYDGMKSRFVYKADCDGESEQTRKEYVKQGWPYQWKPSLFMPKEAARLWLEVTGVKCERLQSITRGDCCREGIQSLNMSASQLAEQGFKYLDYSKPKQFFSEGLDPFWSFNSLWCSINGGDSWELNPWVFVYEFKLIEKP